MRRIDGSRGKRNRKFYFEVDGCSATASELPLDLLCTPGISALGELSYKRACMCGCVEVRECGDDCCRGAPVVVGGNGSFRIGKNWKSDCEKNRLLCVTVNDLEGRWSIFLSRMYQETRTKWKNNEGIKLVIIDKRA